MEHAVKTSFETEYHSEVKQKIARLLHASRIAQEPIITELKRMSSAMTNEVYMVTLANNQRVLARFYGLGTNMFFKREKEVATFRVLSENGYGPKLLGSFEGGRFEEFLDCTTMTHSCIKRKETSQEVARLLYQFHCIFPRENKKCELWDVLEGWNKKAEEAYLKMDHLKREKFLADPTIVRKELTNLKHYIEKLNPEVVFCHNDAQYGNIIRLNDNKRLMMVDYEYSCYAYVGFDIGNHFCEWSADYDSAQPHRLYFERYPDDEQQLVFIKAYLTEKFQNEQKQVSEEVLKLECEKMKKEIDYCSLISHLQWYLWGMIQTAHSQIDFDYLDYANQRFREYKNRKPMEIN